MGKSGQVWQEQNFLRGGTRKPSWPVAVKPQSSFIQDFVPSTQGHTLIELLAQSKITWDREESAWQCQRRVSKTSLEGNGCSCCKASVGRCNFAFPPKKGIWA